MTSLFGFGSKKPEEKKPEEKKSSSKKSSSKKSSSKSGDKGSSVPPPILPKDDDDDDDSESEEKKSSPVRRRLHFGGPRLPSLTQPAQLNLGRYSELGGEKHQPFLDTLEYNIEPEHITDKDIEEYKISKQTGDALVRRIYEGVEQLIAPERDTSAHMYDIDTVIQSIKPKDILKFLNDPVYYNEVILELRGLAHDVSGPFEIDMSGGALDDYHTQEEKMTQLEAIIYTCAKYDQLAKLQYITDLDTKQYVEEEDEKKDLSIKFTKKQVDFILNKQTQQIFNPELILTMIINKYEQYVARGLVEPLDELVKIRDAFRQDIINVEHGRLDYTEYQKKIENFFDVDVNTMFKNRKEINSIFREARDDVRQRSLYDLNMFYDYLKYVNEINRSAPETQLAKYMTKLTQTIVKELKDGTVNLSEAFDKINAIRKLTKPYLQHPASFKVKTEEKREPHEDKPDPITLKDQIEPYVKQGAFYYPGVTILDKEHVRKYQIRDLPVYAIMKTYRNQGPARWFRSAINEFWVDPVHDPSTGKTEPGLKVGQEVDKMTQSDIVKAVDTMLKHVRSNVYFKFDHSQFKILDLDKSAPLEDWQREFADFVRQFKLIDKWFQDYKNVTTTARGKLPIPASPKKIDSTKAARLIATVKPLLPPPKEARPPVKYDETAEQKEHREKIYTTENILYSMQPKKEYPEIYKSEHGLNNNIFEYTIKNEEDLKRMRSEVQRMEGDLFVVDLATGKLYPIEWKQTMVGQTYIFKRKGTDEEEGGSFAQIPALKSILRDELHLLPYEFMRDGRDKAMNRLHDVARRPYHPDYRDEIRYAQGAGFWKHIKKGIHQAANYVGDRTVSAANDLAKQSVKEGRNFVQQEKRNLSNIYSSGRTFARDPSLRTFGNLYSTTGNSLGKFVAQPLITAAREAANVSDFAGKVPGLNVVKYGAEWALPPLAVADALSHAVKNTAIGSNDKPRYLDALINVGDGILGTGALKGTANNAAMLINTGAKITDYFVDDHKN